MWLYKEKYNSWVASNYQIYRDNDGAAKCPECREKMGSVWPYLLSHGGKFQILDDDGALELKVHYGKHECGAHIAVIDDYRDDRYKVFLLKDYSNIWKNE
jgi:hypothetical protein